MTERIARIKPNFFVIGAAKSGTMSLYKLLNGSPEVAMSKIKEPCYFSSDKNFQRPWKWYERFFVGTEGAVAIGEASVNYSMRSAFPKTAKRIAEAIPEAKLVYMVRHPLDRIVSHWRMNASRDPATPEFNQAVRTKSLMPEYVDRSKYWFQISAYRDYFSDAQILVLFFEDFKANPEGSVRRCLDFLDVNSEMKVLDLETQYNTAEQRGTYTFLLRFLYRLPISGLVRATPEGWKRWGKSLPLFTRRKAVSSPEWDSDTRKWVIEQVAEDTRIFLDFYGKPADFWLF
jgi:hypothetical protein